MIESVNRSSSKGPKKGWGSTICGALRVPGLSPVVLGLSSSAEHRSAGPSVLPPQRFYEGTKFTVPSSSLAAVPPAAPPVDGRLWYGLATKLLRSNSLFGPTRDQGYL